MPQPTTSKPTSRWVRPLRLFLWLIATVALSVSLFLHIRSQSSLAFSSSTSHTLVVWSRILFWPAIILATLNLIWGITRWFLRWQRERWHPGKIVGKLIGGGIWRFLTFSSLVALSLLILAPPIYRLISHNTIASQSAFLENSASLLASAYAAGEINADTYLTYLLDATYNNSALPEIYQNSELFMAPDFLGFIDQHFDELSPELILSTLETVTLANIDFDTDASSNISSSPDLFSNNAYAYTKKITTLNKAYLSPNQKFVIFYTDTGDDAVSDSSVVTIAETLESIIDSYSNNLGLNYEYQLYSVSNSKTKKMTKVLESNNIPSNITDTAMSVYIANPYKNESNVLATYAGRRFAETTTNILIKLGALFGEETAKFYSTTPAYPFVNILPSNLSNESLALVIAHELGHHYASNYCYATTNQTCSDDDFISETAPNWFAINVISDQPTNNLLRSHHDLYVSYGTCYKIDNVLPEPPKEHACHNKGTLAGYPAVAFLQNYSEIVPDATNKILTALTTDNALQSLYDSAGPDHFRQVMTQLTERNITNDYGPIAALYATNFPHGEEIPCTDLCTESYYIAPASSRYLYFPPAEYPNATLTVSAAHSTISILGRRNDIWYVISSQDQNATFDMTTIDDYDAITFGIANYSITDPDEFTLSVTAKPLEDLIEESVKDSNLENPIVATFGNCTTLDIVNVIDLPIELYRMLTQLDPSQDFSSVLAELEAEAAEVKNQLTYRYATICHNHLSPNTDFNSARTSIKTLSGFSFEVFRLNEPDLHLSMIAAYNPFQLDGQVYLLFNTDNTTDLITIRMSEKLPSQ